MREGQFAVHVGAIRLVRPISASLDKCWKHVAPDRDRVLGHGDIVNGMLHIFHLLNVVYYAEDGFGNIESKGVHDNRGARKVHTDAGDKEEQFDRLSRTASKRKHRLSSASTQAGKHREYFLYGVVNRSEGFESFTVE